MQMKNEKGFSLVMAIIAGMFLSILGYVTISAVIIDNRIGVHHLQSTQAFWIAESGIELATRWLRFQDPPPGGIVPFIKYDHEPLGAGSYTVTIDPDDNNTNTYLKKYKVVSVGEVDKVVRKIEVEMEMTTFNRYAYLTGDEGGTIWFNTGDLIEGPLHSNDQISIIGSPVFMGKVTSSASSFNKGSPYNPDFQDGYQLGVPPIFFPTQQDIIDNYWAVNTEPPQLIIDARFGKEASIEFNPDGTLTYNVWHWENGQQVYDIQNAVANIADLNGLVFVKGDVEVKGTLDGVITLIATKNIYITDNLVYEMSDASGKPLPNSDDMLGLISFKNIVVADNAANRDDVIINAAILTLDKSFTVENYWSGSPRGKLTIWGSLSQKVRGPVGTFGWWGTTGYQKDYHYDSRFIDTPPPYYPSTGQYHYNYWREITDE
ncbi:MAG: DUF4900 domain-containing protein [Calditrichaeota bacterium]|nr:MAG: DUF4900 domain-containing protein [Calditrichota bacterium]